jgi:hypothetical protein
VRVFAVRGSLLVPVVRGSIPREHESLRMGRRGLSMPHTRVNARDRHLSELLERCTQFAVVMGKVEAAEGAAPTDTRAAIAKLEFGVGKEGHHATELLEVRAGGDDP